jgi:hypothetical protein
MWLGIKIFWCGIGLEIIRKWQRQRERSMNCGQDTKHSNWTSLKYPLSGLAHPVSNVLILLVIVPTR